MRVEHDPLGPVEVPENALYGAHTARAIENFGVSGHTIGEFPDMVKAYAGVKIAAARANLAIGVISPEIATAVIAAARELKAGLWSDQFPSDFVQGGGGTATNMNVNEVIANRACVMLGGTLGTYAPVHPNDHVNRSQSTNDTYPTAAALASVCAGERTESQLERLERACVETAGRANGAERLGRTCLQDAVAVPAAATHTALAAALRRGREQLHRALDDLMKVPLGGTAVGTGFGAPDGYRESAVAYLAEEMSLPLRATPDPFDALRHLDGFAAVAHAVCRIGLVLRQSAADVRLLASGPRGGLREIRIPAVQVGSSCMPGKVNPVIPELVIQVSFEIQAAAHAVELATAAGELELNVMEPVAVKSVLTALRQLGNVAEIYAERCISGLMWNELAIEKHLAGSLAAAVRLAETEGYNYAAASEHKADRSFRERR